MAEPAPSGAASLWASVRRLEALAKTIPAWKFGTIVFAQPEGTPPKQSEGEPTLANKAPEG